MWVGVLLASFCYPFKCWTDCFTRPGLPQPPTSTTTRLPPQPFRPSLVQGALPDSLAGAALLMVFNVSNNPTLGPTSLPGTMAPQIRALRLVIIIVIVTLRHGITGWCLGSTNMRQIACVLAGALLAVLSLSLPAAYPCIGAFASSSAAKAVMILATCCRVACDIPSAHFKRMAEIPKLQC